MIKLFFTIYLTLIEKEKKENISYDINYFNNNNFDNFTYNLNELNENNYYYEKLNECYLKIDKIINIIKLYKTNNLNI